MPKVKVNVSLKKSVLDPQGKTVEHALKSLGHKNISDVRIGKIIEFEIKEKNKDKINKQVVSMCKKLLANPVIETYSIELE